MVKNSHFLTPHPSDGAGAIGFAAHANGRNRFEQVSSTRDGAAYLAGLLRVGIGHPRKMPLTELKLFWGGRATKMPPLTGLAARRLWY